MSGTDGPPQKPQLGKGSFRVTSAQLGSAVVALEKRNAEEARRTLQTLRHVRRAPQGDNDAWLRGTCAQIHKSRGTSGGSGAFGQQLGHYIELSDIEAYNARNRFSGKRLVPVTNPNHRGYDALRVINGKPAGGVQHKASEAGLEKAIKTMEAVTSGSATRGTMRVPKGYGEAATARARGRIRVSEMPFSRKQAERAQGRALKRLQNRGEKAASTRGAVLRGAGGAAVAATAIGAIREVGALRSGELSGSVYLENRLFDAGEGAAAAIGCNTARIGVAGVVSGGLATTQGVALVAACGAGGPALVAGAPIVVGLGASLLVGHGISRTVGWARQKRAAAR